MHQVDKARSLRREYSTCIGSIISVGGRRICGTCRIVHIVLFSNWSIVVFTNTIPELDKARRLRRILFLFTEIFGFLCFA